MSTEIKPQMIDADEATESSRKMDDELKVIAAMLRALNELEEPARARVVAYLSDRYRQQGAKQ